MSPFSTLPALLSLLSVASALPSLSFEVRQNVIPFDASSQYVSNKGANAYIAPTSTDRRSPCPALNVMANHGYIPRNGYVTLLQMEEALPKVYGISNDLASVLNLIFLSASMKGNAYDIGGFPASLVGETAYQFIQTYNIGSINSNNPMQQICTNYNKINGAQYHNSDFFSMGGAINDELFFRAFANKSATYPLGSLESATKLAMLAMTPNGDGTFTWNKFQNAIPDNWYKANLLAPFSVPVFAADLLAEYAYSCLPGQSGSGGYSYKGYDMALLTNGAFTNAQLAADPQANMCFLIQAAPLVLPTFAKQPMFNDNTRTNVASAVSDWQKATKSFDCSAHVMKSMNLGALGKALGLNLLL